MILLSRIFHCKWKSKEVNGSGHKRKKKNWNDLKEGRQMMNSQFLTSENEAEKMNAWTKAPRGNPRQTFHG